MVGFQVKWLLRRGAKITHDKYGKTPMNDAAENEQLEVREHSQQNQMGPLSFNHYGLRGLQPLDPIPKCTSDPNTGLKALCRNSRESSTESGFRAAR